MEKVIRNNVSIVIAGHNVTGDVSPYLSKASYSDRVEAESDDVSLVFEDTLDKWKGPWYPSEGDTMEVSLGPTGGMLNCGTFEIDEIELSFAPDILTVKAIGAAVTKGLRTKNSKAFEKQSLHKIAKYFADKHSLKLVGKTGELQKIEIERKTQEKQTDISFLSQLAKEYGIIFSVRGDQLIFMDNDELETQDSVMTIDKAEMNRGSFKDKTSQIYAGATVATRDIKSNSVKKWNVEASTNGASKAILVVKGRAESQSQAEAKAKSALKDKNKDKFTGSFSMPGNPKLVAGVNVTLTGIGNFSGKWHIVSSGHSIDKSGYTTDLEVRKIFQ